MGWNSSHVLPPPPQQQFFLFNPKNAWKKSELKLKWLIEGWFVARTLKFGISTLRRLNFNANSFSCFSRASISKWSPSNFLLLLLLLLYVYFLLRIFSREEEWCAVRPITRRLFSLSLALTSALLKGKEEDAAAAAVVTLKAHWRDDVRDGMHAVSHNVDSEWWNGLHTSIKTSTHTHTPRCRGCQKKGAVVIWRGNQWGMAQASGLDASRSSLN